MVRASVGAGLLFALMVMGLIAIMPDLWETAEAARTELETDTGLACSTGLGQTSCSLSPPLSTAHAYSNNDGMTVTETSPGSGDRTATTTVGADRQTLTVGGLTQSTAYVFTVEHRIVDPTISTPAAGLLERYGLITALGVLVVFLFWVVRTWFG